MRFSKRLFPGFISAKKPFYLWLILLCTLLVSSLNAEVEAEAEASLQGVLWKIEKADHKPSYLLGTVHVSDPRIVNFKPELKKVMSQVSSISIEAKLDPEAQMAVAMRMLALGSNLEADVGSSYFSKITAEMQKYNMAPDIVRQLKPWAVMLTLSVPPNGDPTKFMDALIYNYGLEHGKNVYGLETLDEQLSIFDSMSHQDQLVLLKQTVDDLAKRDSMMEQMLSVYLQGDLKQLAEISNAHIKEMDHDMARKMMKTLVDDRNLRMLKRMQPRLLEGSALIAVGALHLTGKQGLINLLTEQGYTLKPVY